ncbi:MAG TPA: glycosyltransferase family 2 protein [Candidatus Dormibacteraeota bacterium]|nr:glycosyltransferase family 2 protein [Candidatus Dormibacteraeota bacterium]
MDSSPSVAVQVVLHRSARWLPKLLRGLELLEYPRDRLRVRMLNNSPGDGSRALIERLSPRLLLGYEDSAEGNIGFGRGHNHLARQAGPETDLLLLLNPDTIPFHDCLLRLVERARSAPDAALVEACQFPLEHPKAYDEDGTTGWCSAACLLVRNRVYRELGGFDERLFLYCEDVDLSWRCWLAGHRCVVEPSARCVHVTQRTDHGKDLSGEILHGYVGGLFLRQRYFGEPAVARYRAAMRPAVPAETADRALSAFDSIRPETTAQTHPRIAERPDQQYAALRWNL